MEAVSLGVIIGIAWAVAWPPLFAGGWPRLLRRLVGRPSAVGFWGLWIIAAVCTIFSLALAGDYPASLVAAVSAVFGAVMWWLNRRRRDRARKLTGAKSKALRDALVRQVRENARPRPVLRPVPGGAG